MRAISATACWAMVWCQFPARWAGTQTRPAALPIDPYRQWIGYGMNHLDLLNRAEVYAALLALLADPARDRS